MNFYMPNLWRARLKAQKEVVLMNNRLERGVRLRRGKEAFTFVEMLIVLILMSVLGISVFSALGSGIRIWRRVHFGSENEDKHIFLQKLSQDLRNYRAYKGLPIRTNTRSLSFPALFLTQAGEGSRKESFQPFYQLGMVSYEYFPSEKTIVKTQVPYAGYMKKAKGTSSILARNISDVKFSYFYRGEFGVSENKSLNEKGAMPVLIEVVVDHKSQTGESGRISDYIDIPMSY